MPKDKPDNTHKKRIEPKTPKWMDCAWRRVPCNKSTCKICKRIKQDRVRHIAGDESPDDLAAAFEDVGRNFREALILIKKDAERMGIDIANIESIKEPPEPHTFPLYRKVARWRESIYDIAENAEDAGSFWLATEPAEDLLWYTSTFTAKTYRQLCNHWHIERKDGYEKLDYDYTKYVLGEVTDILSETLSELAYFDSGQKGELLLAGVTFDKLKKSVLKI